MNAISSPIYAENQIAGASTGPRRLPSALVTAFVAALHIAAIWWMLQVAQPVLQQLEFTTISGVIIPQQPVPPQVVEPPPPPPPPPPQEQQLISQPESPLEIPLQEEIPEPEPMVEPVQEIEPVPEPILEPTPEPVPEPVHEIEPLPEPVDEVIEPAIEAPQESVSFTEPLSNAAHLNNPLPVYPRQSQRRKEEGTVLIEVLILADGSVGEARLKQSSGFSRLDRAALKAVRYWRYVPAMRGGSAIDYWYQQPVVFALK